MAWETELQIIIAAATNLTLVPAVFYAYRRKQSFNFIICLAALITSIMYHTCDAWEHQSWGTNLLVCRLIKNWPCLCLVLVTLCISHHQLTSINQFALPQSTLKSIKLTHLFFTSNHDTFIFSQPKNHSQIQSYHSWHGCRFMAQT